jgi:hypothetical protein
LAKRPNDLDQIALRLHDRVDRLVGARRLVHYVGVLAALDAGGRARVVFDRERLFWRRSATWRGLRRGCSW